MSRLRDSIAKEYSNNPDYSPQLFEPMNTQAVELYFPRPKIAKVVGSLAESALQSGEIDGVVVKNNFDYTVLAPQDMEHFFNVPVCTVSQKLAIPFSESSELLTKILHEVSR